MQSLKDYRPSFHFLLTIFSVIFMTAGFVLGINLMVRANATSIGANISTPGNLLVEGNATTTGSFTVGTSTFIVDSSSRRVGIGIKDPSSYLHVNGDIKAVGIWDSDGDTGVQVEKKNNDNKIRFDIKGNEVLTISSTTGMYVNNIAPEDANNIVGIKLIPSNTSMDANLDSIIGFYSEPFFNNSFSDSVSVKAFYGDNDMMSYVVMGDPILPSEWIGYGFEDLPSNKDFYYYAKWGDDFSVSGSGNVGIGTVSPSSKLQIEDGDVYINSASNGVILTSPDSTCYRLTIENGGGFATSSIPCP